MQLCEVYMSERDKDTVYHTFIPYNYYSITVTCKKTFGKMFFLFYTNQREATGFIFNPCACNLEASSETS